MIAWTGSLAVNNPGTTSASFKAAILQRINYFRQWQEYQLISPSMMFLIVKPKLLPL
jgi:hypothetical protein